MFPPSVGTNLMEPWLRPPTQQNPNSNEEHPHPLFHFPTSNEHDLSMNQHVLFQNQMLLGNPFVGIDPNGQNHVEMKAKGKLMNPKMEKKVDQSLRRRNIGVTAPRRRVGKKDRHSKICTAQGIRDRRMRLSLQAARKFFDLQDMLGYDKASKTIEWLFTKSKKAIKELTKEHTQGNSNVSDSDAKSESFVSECDEVVSGIEESSNKDVKDGDKESKNIEKSQSKPKVRGRSTTNKKKMMMIEDESTKTENDHHLQKLGFSISTTFEVPPPDQDPTYTDQARILPFGVDYEQQPPDSGTLETLLGIPSSSSAPSNSHHFSSDDPLIDPNTNFMGFLTSWDYLIHERAGSSNVTHQISLPSNTSSNR